MVMKGRVEEEEEEDGSRANYVGENYREELEASKRDTERAFGEEMAYYRKQLEDGSTEEGR
jgi:hypothetical protein